MKLAILILAVAVWTAPTLADPPQPTTAKYQTRRWREPKPRKKKPTPAEILAGWVQTAKQAEGALMFAGIAVAGAIVWGVSRETKEEDSPSVSNTVAQSFIQRLFRK